MSRRDYADTVTQRWYQRALRDGLGPDPALRADKLLTFDEALGIALDLRTTSHPRPPRKPPLAKRTPEKY